MSQPEEKLTKIVPAQLNFLAIYNPHLGDSEDKESLQGQIFFYYSRASSHHFKKKTKPKQDSQNGSHDDQKNEQMRQVGLAQGMVNFAKTFSHGEPVDSVETEKHRIVIRELESDWWILASIDLTRIPVSRTSQSKPPSEFSPSVEYSSREVSPPDLLLQQLEQAHRIFLLHHGTNLAQIASRLTRERFEDVLQRFWANFALNWDVMLHGNPSADIYGGIKLAAGGELGIGVGEEDWGSGEREVLESLIRNTEGLVDLVLSTFGGPEQLKSTKDTNKATQKPSAETSFFGQGHDPGPNDGLLFSGLGALSETSLQSLTDWIKLLYMYGQDAYGVRDNPSSARTKSRRKTRPGPNSRTASNTNGSLHRGKSYQKPQSSKATTPGAETTTRLAIPPPIVSVAEASLKAATTSLDQKSSVKPKNQNESVVEKEPAASQQWVKYLTLGYGSVWGSAASSEETSAKNQPSSSKEATKDTKDSKSGQAKPQVPPTDRKIKSQIKTSSRSSKTRSTDSGYFLIGLGGDLDGDDQFTNDAEAETELANREETDWSSRLSLRTIHIGVRENSNMAPKYDEQEAADEHEEEARNNIKRLRVVVYVHPPFIYTLLFEPDTASLLLPSFFHDLHHHLTPLHGLLLRSTSPSRVTDRLKSIVYNSESPVFDVVHCPQSLATRCSIPNIPHLGTAISGAVPSAAVQEAALNHTTLSRAEAISIHSQVLQTYIDTRKSPVERERTMKTSKGWWVVWMRAPTSGSQEVEGIASGATSQHVDDDDQQNSRSEAVLVRRAKEPMATKSSWMSSSYAPSSLRVPGNGALGRLVGLSGTDSSPDASVPVGPGSSSKLTEGLGLGVDPKKYVEVLLSLNR